MSDPVYFMKIKAGSDPVYAITPSNGWTESGIVNGRISLYFYIPEDEEQNTYFNIGSTGDPSSWGWIYQFFFYKKAGTDIYLNLDKSTYNTSIYNLSVGVHKFEIYVKQSPDYRQDFYLDNKLLFQSETEIPALKGLNTFGNSDYSFFANIMIEDLDPENKKKVTIDFSEFNSFEGDVISFLNSKGITEWSPGALDKIKIIDITSKPNMTISSPDVLNGSSINRSFIDVTFTSSENTSDFTVDDIQINNGYLINFSGSEKVYTATLIIIESDKTCTVDVPASSFVGESFSNEAAQQFVWRKNIINVPIKKDKDKAKLLTRILKMTEPDTNSFLTQFRAFMANDLFSVSEKEIFQDFLFKNSQYSRAILFKILDLLDGHSVLNSQVSMRHGIVEYNDFRIMNQLLEGSLGDDIMNKYLVNREPGVFNNISRFSSYLFTDFYHTMEDYSLVLSGGHDTLVSDLNLILVSESRDLVSSLLQETNNKLIDVSSTSTDSFYGSMNAGMKAIVDSLNELSQEEDAMSDFRNLINEYSNGVGSSLGNMKLTLIKKFLVPILQDLDYLKDSYYGLPVLINKEIV